MLLYDILSDKQVKRGQDITISWEANTDAKGKWKKNGEVLEEGSRIHFRKFNRNFTLTIKDAKEEDEGKYTLELKNMKGTASGSATVRLLGMTLNSANTACVLEYVFIDFFEI